MGIPKEAKCIQIDHTEAIIYADDATPHEKMVTNLTYLCPYKDNKNSQEVKVNTEPRALCN